MEQESKYRQPHNEVPDKTILRYVLRENGALKAENEELQEKIKLLERQLANKAKAISAFKEWQSKVAEYNVEYWLNQGIELMKEPPKKELIKALRQYVCTYHTYKDKVNTLISLIQKLEAKREVFEKVIKQEIEDGTV